jgi:hypothetical protein
MVDTGRNCARPFQPLVGIWRSPSIHKIARLSRLDGQYGNGAVLSDVASFAFVTRGKDYHLLDHPLIQARLHFPPDQFQQRPESQMVRSLYDCLQIPVGPEGVRCRVVVATHPSLAKRKVPSASRARASSTSSSSPTCPSLHSPPAMSLSCTSIAAHYAPTLSDEDQEIDPDRWCSHSAWGQECWQLVSQWVWNLRLELGHQLEPTPIRITEFVPALPPPSPHTASPSGYAPPHMGLPWKTGRISGQDFALQPDGTLRCQASQKLTPHEQRREADGSLRIVYGASIRSCRPCPLREQCQWQGSTTSKPRQESRLFHPLGVAPDPLLWKDWSRRQHRRICMQLLRHQRVEILQAGSGNTATLVGTPAPLSRAQRAHTRLCWEDRLARNAAPSASLAPGQSRHPRGSTS